MFRVRRKTVWNCTTLRKSATVIPLYSCHFRVCKDFVIKLWSLGSFWGTKQGGQYYFNDQLNGSQLSFMFGTKIPCTQPQMFVRLSVHPSTWSKSLTLKIITGDVTQSIRHSISEGFFCLCIYCWCTVFKPVWRGPMIEYRFLFFLCPS